MLNNKAVIVSVRSYHRLQTYSSSLTLFGGCCVQKELVFLTQSVLTSFALKPSYWQLMFIINTLSPPCGRKKNYRIWTCWILISIYCLIMKDSFTWTSWNQKLSPASTQSHLAGLMLYTFILLLNLKIFIWDFLVFGGEKPSMQHWLQFRLWHGKGGIYSWIFKYHSRTDSCDEISSMFINKNETIGLFHRFSYMCEDWFYSYIQVHSDHRWSLKGKWHHVLFPWVLRFIITHDWPLHVHLEDEVNPAQVIQT